jgi:FixJ family two-component response regulator
MVERGLLSVVDDDESIRESLPDFLRSFGHEVRAYASAEEFLRCSEGLTRTSCLVLDVVMPGMSGQDLQLELARQGRNIPIVFITANADALLCQQVLSRGAVACLSKPFSECALMDAVAAALGRL